MRKPVGDVLGKSYEPKVFEADLYSYWEKEECFKAADENAPGQESFCIVIPPPNVTGVLHMGHALTNTIQDILTRWKRMQGFNTLWLPGTDHAGIATQSQVEKKLAKEGRSRKELGRKAFLQEVWAWKEEHASFIKQQLQRLGSSLDWSRERFTMDEGFSAAVREVFVRLYEDGLIYRGERMINWSVALQTAISDLEVIPTERKSQLWHIKYPVSGGSDYIVIATTRPETLLGDTAVAVHPEDERYKKLHGKKFKVPLSDREIPLILDEYVDREFGSGGLKVTPSHDFNDYELGKKHGLPLMTVIGLDGKMTAAAGAYAGLKIAEARSMVIQDLTDQGLLVKTEEIVNKVGICQRSGTVAEPMISKQWFVKIEKLAKPAIEAVETGAITFTPENWKKTYFEWMYNIKDWCISRQLWWGHQIPAWHCVDCSEITVARVTPQACSKCGSKGIKQDEDVLDTWFSSGLWPFGTLGWPEKTHALKTFYPTSILETGFDIIFFWVARMIMMGLYFMKEENGKGIPPFSKVYLHAMVRDEKGEKMSKTKGNVIDPLGLIEDDGADSLRFTLASMSGQGRDIKLSVDRVEDYRAFCNKLWNAVKFFHYQWDEEQGGPTDEPLGGSEKYLKDNYSKLSIENQWILSRLQNATLEVEKGLENFELNRSSQALHTFTWNELCDWYIEFAKLPLREGSKARKQTLITLHYVLESTLNLLHPFIPFVTEQLWLSLPWKKAQTIPTRARDKKPALETLMFQKFYQSSEAWRNLGVEADIYELKGIIENVRNFRGENNLSPKIEFPLYLKINSQEWLQKIKVLEKQILTLTRCSKIIYDSPDITQEASKSALTGCATELYIVLEGLVNKEEELKRITKEFTKAKQDLEFVTNKLSRPDFIAKAPPQLVAKETQKQTELTGQVKDLEAALAKLQKRS
ncbi:MAG: valine--tRNA ligase [Xanthomonadaceae bacterium]|nr:valine--tRNA ligase [Xanthomonadaceae bacterium]